MLELLSSFSIAQILIFTVLLAIAFKKVSDFMDWLQLKISKKNKTKQSEEEWKTEVKNQMNDFKASLTKIDESVTKVTDKVNVLMDSDKDDIKAFITQQHHFFVYQKKWIDDYSLDCLEHRFLHYKEENGNSFIEQLMNEIRALPKQPTNGESE